MDDRYGTLFVLKEFYSSDCPVAIEAGKLLRDTRTGKILALVKLYNLIDRSIKAVEIEVNCYNDANKHIGNPILFSYLDLEVTRDTRFGEKKPIVIPDVTTRRIDVKVTRVVFSDGSDLEVGQTEWRPIPSQELLRDKLGEELATQYQRDVSESATYEPITIDGFWKCTCGAINKVDEGHCHACTLEKTKQFLNLDRNILFQNKSSFEKELEKSIEKEEKKQKKIKKYLLILAAVAIAFVFIADKTIGVFPLGRDIKSCEFIVNGDYYDTSTNATAIDDGHGVAHIKVKSKNPVQDLIMKVEYLPSGWLDTFKVSEHCLVRAKRGEWIARTVRVPYADKVRITLYDDWDGNVLATKTVYVSD